MVTGVCVLNVLQMTCMSSGSLLLDKSSLLIYVVNYLQALLHFIYSDELPDFTEIDDSMPASSTIMMQHLLAAADQFGLDRLKLLCEAKLCEEFSTDTVATTLSLAEQHHCTQLKPICLKFAAANLGGACSP